MLIDYGEAGPWAKAFCRGQGLRPECETETAWLYFDRVKSGWWT